MAGLCQPCGDEMAIAVFQLHEEQDCPQCERRKLATENAAIRLRETEATRLLTAFREHLSAQAFHARQNHHLAVDAGDGVDAQVHDNEALVLDMLLTKFDNEFRAYLAKGNR